MSRETSHVLVALRTFKALGDTEDGIALYINVLRTCEVELSNALDSAQRGSSDEEKLRISLTHISELKKHCLHAKDVAHRYTELLETVWKEGDGEDGVPSLPKTSPRIPEKDAKAIPTANESKTSL